MPEPIHLSAVNEDWSPRIATTSAVVASPAAAAETIIAQVAISDRPALLTGVILRGWAAFTVGTSGTAVRLRVRQTNVAGAVVTDTGAVTAGIVAAALAEMAIAGTDAAAVGAQVYVLTMQVTAGAAVSTVSAVHLYALLV